MRSLCMISILSLMWLIVAGCSTNQGGTSSNDNDLLGGNEVFPGPRASPTQRPGMNPEDPRDPQYITRPQPTVPPPTTKP